MCATSVRTLQSRSSTRCSSSLPPRARSPSAPYQTLSVTIAAKGKAKVGWMLADGTKVSAKGQLVVGEEWCCVPVRVE